MMMMCGGKGLIQSVVTGPGLVVIQSMPKEVVAAHVLPPKNNSGGGGGGEGGGGGGGGGD